MARILAVGYFMRGKTIPITFTVGVFLFLAFSVSMGAQPPHGDYAIVMELIQRWEAEMERRGLEFYISRYGSPLQETRDNGGKKGRSEPVDISIEDVRVFKRDDGIIATTFVRRATSGEFRDLGVGMLSFRRENGRWRVDGEEWYPLSEEALAKGNEGVMVKNIQGV